MPDGLKTRPNPTGRRPPGRGGPPAAPKRAAGSPLSSGPLRVSSGALAADDSCGRLVHDRSRQAGGQGALHPLDSPPVAPRTPAAPQSRRASADAAASLASACRRPDFGAQGRACALRLPPAGARGRAAPVDPLPRLGPASESAALRGLGSGEGVTPCRTSPPPRCSGAAPPCRPGRACPVPARETPPSLACGRRADPPASRLATEPWPSRGRARLFAGPRACRVAASCPWGCDQALAPMARCVTLQHRLPLLALRKRPGGWLASTRARFPGRTRSGGACRMRSRLRGGGSPLSPPPRWRRDGRSDSVASDRPA